MGLFGFLIRKLKRRLEEEFVKEFHENMGMSMSEAKGLFRDLFARAKEASIEGKTFNYPLNAGDILLEKEQGDEKIRASLAKKRREGVTTDDIRWWWNRHDLERQLILEIDQLDRVRRLRQYIYEDGLGQKQAAQRIRKGSPVYGDQEDTEHTSGDDRPLPYELRNRIVAYTKKRWTTDPEKFILDIDESSTFNALVRKEIRIGNL